MGTKNVYNTIVWLKQLKDNGHMIFDHATLKEHGLDDKKCLMQAARSGFIKMVRRKDASHVKIWQINENRIMRCNRRSVYTED